MARRVLLMVALVLYASLFADGIILQKTKISASGYIDQEKLPATKSVRYDPTWESIDSRPLPAWYDEAKFGIFIHWGVFSVPSYGSEWFWWYWQGEKRPDFIAFVNNTYGPGFTYADFAPHFKATFYEPKRWAKTFEASGAKYIVLTSKHHEGYTMWPSSVSWNWNAMDVGPHRDLVGELADAVRSTTKLRFGLYHSMFEWFNPMFKSDAANNYTTQEYVATKTLPELYDIVNKYKPEIIWSDGAPGSSKYWNSTQFLAWLYNDSPVKITVVTNDRWGDDAMCKHGGFLTCDDRYTPSHLLNNKWEDCMTIDSYSWGYRRNMMMSQILPIETLITSLVTTVSYGGNLLLNVGPTSDGIIPPIFEERLLQIGKWLGVNGEAIYKTQPWPTAQNDSTTPNVWYTSKTNGKSLTVYAIILNSLAKDFIVLGCPKISNSTKVSIVGCENDVEWDTLFTGELIVTIPRQQDLPDGAEWGFTLKLENLQQSETSKQPTVNYDSALSHKSKLLHAWKKSI
ncbi:hypothetical protein RvY_02380 [Ramazzottius varieornatus]|uniref:Putative alpha-L-fucosidase n=1 Tax=Ramazzottius varieornatus TaxID=947166 RepID=A0A1D1UK95_RAMVA|nr:hypothetical protein RvY_02380 [Ramazzottius varieornatus]